MSKSNSYKWHGKTYIKVGPYGNEDVPVNVTEEGVILPRDGVRDYPRYFDSIDEAHKVLNDEWIDKDNKQFGV